MNIVSITIETTDADSVRNTVLGFYPNATISVHQKHRSSNPRSKMVRCIDDGQLYVSVTDAARAYGLDPSGVYRQITGKLRQTGGKRFEYA